MPSASIIDDTTSISYGSPGSPPPTPDIYSFDARTPIDQATNVDKILGIDSVALSAELDVQYDFEISGSDEKLEGEALITHLKESNCKLTEKVKYYRKEQELLQSEVQSCKKEHSDSVSRIRHFYRDLMFYGTSRGARMLKASQQRN